MSSNHDVTETRATQALWQEIDLVLQHEKHAKRPTSFFIKYPLHRIVPLLVLLQLLSIVLCIAWCEYRLSTLHSPQQEAQACINEKPLSKEGGDDRTTFA